MWMNCCEWERCAVKIVLSGPLSEKSRRGLATVPYVPRGLYSARQSDCRVQLRHVNRFVTDLCTIRTYGNMQAGLCIES